MTRLSTYPAVSTYSLYSYHCTKQVGTSSNTCDLYSGRASSEFWSGYRLFWV